MNIVNKTIKILFSGVLMLAYGNLASGQSLLPSLGGDRSGTAGFQFTKIVVDARSASMGSSNMADANDGSSLYWNPALAAQMENSELLAGHTAYFADISMEYLSLVYRTGEFAFGGSVQFLNSGDIKETTETSPLGTGRTFRTTHLSVGLTASQRLTELFSYGLTIRYLDERIEEVDVQTAAIDFGFFYRVGETGLKFGVGINNFGFDASPSGSTTRITPDSVITERDFEDVELPTRFNLAAAYDGLTFDEHSLVFTAQITNPSDNAERFGVGAEYAFMKQFFLRTGYEFGRDERTIPTLGAGINVPFQGNGVSADYSFTNLDRLGSVHRIVLRISI